MTKGRLEAFSDGVIAIIITIMVLELKVPELAMSATNAHVVASPLDELRALASKFSSYVLSFVIVAIYWNNHHHMLHVTHRVNGAILWANMHLLFWLSLVPFVTAWMGQHHFAPLPTALYGVVLLMAAVAYIILQITILRSEGPQSRLARAVGADVKGKISLAMYVAAIPLAFVRPWMAGALFAAVALVWLVPDRRVERALLETERSG